MEYTLKLDLVLSICSTLFTLVFSKYLEPPLGKQKKQFDWNVKTSKRTFTSTQTFAPLYSIIIKYISDHRKTIPLDQL